MKQAREFFYPKGHWAGYARFFSPHIPSRIGDPLLEAIYRVLFPEHVPDRPVNVSEDVTTAIDILSHDHLKHTPDPVTCRPTAQAKQAIIHLQRLGGITLRTMNTILHAENKIIEATNAIKALQPVEIDGSNRDMLGTLYLNALALREQLEQLIETLAPEFGFRSGPLKPGDKVITVNGLGIIEDVRVHNDGLAYLVRHSVSTDIGASRDIYAADEVEPLEMIE